MTTSLTAPERMCQEFLDVTREIPQVPHGCAQIGYTALAPEIQAELPWYSFLTLPMEGDLLQHAVSVTSREHERLGLAPTSHLPTGMRFAWEITQANLASSIPAVEKLDQIAPMTPMLAVRSSSFLLDFGVRDFMRHALGEAADVLRQPAIRKGLTDYQIAILGVAQAFRKKPDTQAQMAAMNVCRQAVTTLTRDPMTARLAELQSDAPAGTDMAAMAHNLTRWEPSAALLARHFGSKEA